MHKTFRPIAAALAIAAIATGPTWSPARAEASASYAYVASEVGGDLFNPRHSKAGTVAPGGWAHVVPDGEEMSLYVDDRGALDGQDIPVIVSDGEKSLFNGCMPVRTAVTVAGIRPGHEVWVRVGRLDVPLCGANATTGVVTVIGGRAR